MCGISCAVTLKSATRNGRAAVYAQDHLATERTYLSDRLNESLEKIKHRGPDARGQWISDDCRVALGHNRLSIIDLSPEAEQPFHDPEECIHVVVNGELYGHDAIREDLIRGGHSFKSQCDSEIVVALYKEHGLSLLSRLRGEFAFSLYDSRTKLFMAANDRYGIKPLYYTVQHGRLLVASEMKAFLPFDWTPEWDVQALWDNAWISDKRTIFRDVYRLRPGHYLSCTGFSALEQQKYWDIEYRDKRELETRTEQEMIEGVRERLLEAIRVRLRADVPVGIFLSGGLDSSVIAGMVKHLMETEGAELVLAIAQRTAEWLDVQKYVVEIDEETIAANFADTFWHVETASADLGAIGKFALSKLPQAHGIKVILTGEGSDEQFAGYFDLQPDFVREPDLSWPSPSNTLPESVRKTLHDTFENDQTNTDGSQMISNRVHDPPEASFAKRQINNCDYVRIVSYSGIRNAAASWVKQECGTNELRAVAVHHAIDGTARDKIMRKWHPLHSSLYIWTKIMLANIHLVQLGDRMEMAHSIEGRQPFLDHHLTEYVNNLPPSMKIRYDPETGAFNEKWVLKEAAKPFIPDEIYKRTKHPFTAPIRFKVDGPVHEMMRSLLTQDAVEQLGFIDWKICEDLLHAGFIEGNAMKMRGAFCIGMLVVIGQRFGVRKAEPEFF
ncbi:asparagine synthase [Pseudovirgaria hyperparasitica]|uniref:Asparagine synthase n=1 Tax=Pseudovirgaria hyperparasitica TaxID=470096 RepID=A0A6A6W9B2_9PEZI|nr:asparagine synthase [Pseudovirgaria hyperparasitica]KAF2759253.1 asparagine synthase [Pseudovirgaria hyperparasitica]